MSLLFDFLPGKKTVKIILPGNTGYSCILGSGKQITLPGKKQALLLRAVTVETSVNLFSLNL